VRVRNNAPDEYYVTETTFTASYTPASRPRPQRDQMVPQNCIQHAKDQRASLLVDKCQKTNWALQQFCKKLDVFWSLKKNDSKS
jgi:hypothetical protein